VKRKSERLRSPANVKKRRFSEEKDALTSKGPRVVIPVVRKMEPAIRTVDSIPSSSAESNAEVLDEVGGKLSQAESEVAEQRAEETAMTLEAQAHIPSSLEGGTPATNATDGYDMFAEDSAEEGEKGSTAADAESTPKAQALPPNIAASRNPTELKDATEDSVVTPKAESVYATPAARASSNYATPATHLAETYPDPITGLSSSQPSPSKPRSKALPSTNRKQAEDIAAAPSQEVQPSIAAAGPSSTASQMDETAEESTPPDTSVATTKHLRFGSEDPSPPTQELPSFPASQNSGLTTDAADAESDSSDDEAPEAITKSTALTTTRAATAGAALAISAQESAAKDKRRQQEARRREQADANKKAAQRRARKEAKRREREGEIAHLDEEEGGDIDPAVPGTSIETAMEETEDGYLPAALLAGAPAVRPPTPETHGVAASRQSQQSQQRRKKVFAGLNEKPVRDVKRGPVTVKVLEKRNELLPPKVNNRSMSVRESWLKGRQGRPAKGKKKGVLGGKMERKEVGRGFLRR